MIDKFLNTRDEEVKNLKVLYEQLIASKDAEIERLQQLVNQLLTK